MDNLTTMLTSETKQRINTCRDILVGKLPDPKSQVLQITNALIYKFMDDQDRMAEKLGGKPSFFINGLKPYAWHKLFDARLTGQERADKYIEGLSKLSAADHLPELFREVFKEAYLPFRDARVISLFLTEINNFDYTHSEELGNAYEYLLSIMGSQGDAGQFRTPRHIIEFLVDVVDPKKDETIYDPAAGTAGFLIAAYNHIVEENKKLSAGERRVLGRNISGVDISPDMAKMARVNLYLHGFTTPNIQEGDTLTDEHLWGTKYDVIMANPPFMSPKGGIRPHDKFSMKSTRSEVLFVDYIAEHLRLKGRAGIIVPEGIIFQSQAVYKQLRKLLVEDYLVAVVSLPAGVFNPYSGVKTSILFLDRSLAKQAQTIAFFKVENDGFSLGAQRREIDKNDLPQVEAELAAYFAALRNGATADEILATASTGLIISKEKIAANGDYNLSGERYRQGAASGNQRWQLVPLSDVCSLQRGLSYSTDEIGDEHNGVPFYNLKSIKRQGSVQRNDFKYFTGEIKEKHFVTLEDVLVALTDLTPTSELIGSPKLITDPIKAAYSADLGKLVFKDDRVHPHFLYHLLRSVHYRNYIVTYSHGANVKHLQADGFYNFLIPLLPLEVQREIVAEIEGYQKVIDGARAVLDHYRPHIPIDPGWPIVELGKIVDKLESGVSVNSSNRPTKRGEIGILKTSCVTRGVFEPEEHKTVLVEEVSRVQCPVRGNTIIISRMNTEALVGANAYVEKDYPNLFLPDRLWQTVITRPDVNVRYVQTVLASDECRTRISARCGGTSGSMKNISKPQLLSLTIPLPSLATQQAIVAELEAEQALVAANRELITRFERKIQATLARIWGAEPSDKVEGASEAQLEEVIN
ncbi:MAG: N-6 DNA methylase [Beijerinckiaceae bacterium]